MGRLLRYFAGLTVGRVVLWCYAVWYVVSITLRFDPRPRIWITSLGLSGIIGIAIVLFFAGVLFPVGKLCLGLGHAPRRRNDVSVG